MTTPIETQCEILGELWSQYRGDETFEQFIAYSDLALPLAYSISSDIISITPKAQMFIEESWLLLLEALGVEDLSFSDLNDLFDASDYLN
jgi:hypothetical protein